MKIVFIGSGNVAFHLSQGLQQAGADILLVYSRKLKNAKYLAKLLNCPASNNLEKISSDADLYIIAVHDDAIGSVAEKLSTTIGNQKQVVHTSGSIPSTVLKPWFKKYGIFYPLQTFSKNKSANLSEVPFCIHSSRKDFREKLFRLAKTVSQKVFYINDQERSRLHVAAVMVNNFTNHLYHMAYRLVEKEGLSFETLIPLIQETAGKVKSGDPYDMQTGPARRGDRAVIKKHLVYLEAHPEMKEIYSLMTQSILKIYHKK